MMTWFLNMSPWSQFVVAVVLFYGIFTMFVSCFVWAVVSINQPREEEPWNL